MGRTEGTVMLCPMRIDDKGRMGRCEESRCAWWVTEVSRFAHRSACAIAILASGDPIGRRVVNGADAEQ